MVSTTYLENNIHHTEIFPVKYLHKILHILKFFQPFCIHHNVNQSKNTKMLLMYQDPNFKINNTLVFYIDMIKRG